MTSKPDIVGRFQNMELNEKDINILLLGETGVGKSTFINAFSNYVEHETFEKAERRKVKCCIPSKFTVCSDANDTFEEKTVSIGADSNEDGSMFHSATQGPRSYLFDQGKHRIRLIDTPGIGDTRGIQQDDENLENILSYVSELNHLHGICFLLKPNSSRLTVMFEYCIKQLLSRLEKSAGKNILFVFTNSRGTFYQPGDTLPVIRKILEDSKKNPPHVHIPFGKENVFCLDNESFRYLVAIQNKITLDNKETFMQSWVQSFKECKRLILYLTGEGQNKLTPHNVKDTVSVNEARRVVVQLSKPLADIAEVINDNIYVLECHTKTLEMDNKSVKSLKSKMYVPVVNLRHKKLSQPTTICASSKCAEVHMIGGRSKYHYKQRCHDPCYLTNVPREIIGDAGLIHCAAMGRNRECNMCSCDFSAHMHIYYTTETYDDKVEDASVKAQIKDRESAIEETSRLILIIKERKYQYELEKQIIVKAMAQFAHFLQQNAIAPYNDSYKAYIEYLIDREKSLGPNCNQQFLQELHDLMKQYQYERDTLENAFQIDSSNKGDGKISADTIFNAIRDLYRLKHMGKEIEEMHQLQAKSQRAEFENSEVVFDKETDYDDDGDSSVKSAESGAVKRKSKKSRKKPKENTLRSYQQRGNQYNQERGQHFQRNHRDNPQEHWQYADHDPRYRFKNVPAHSTARGNFHGHFHNHQKYGQFNNPGPGDQFSTQHGFPPYSTPHGLHHMNSMPSQYNGPTGAYSNQYVPTNSQSVDGILEKFLVKYYEKKSTGNSIPKQHDLQQGFDSNKKLGPSAIRDHEHPKRKSTMETSFDQAQTNRSTIMSSVKNNFNEDESDNGASETENRKKNPKTGFANIFDN